MGVVPGLAGGADAQAGRAARHLLIRASLVAVALHVTLAGWAVLELSLRVRERLQGRGGATRDRATRALIAVALGAAITLAAVTASRTTASTGS